MTNRLRPLALMLGTAFLGLFTTPAEAWGGKGHSMAAQAALEALPEEFPAFFRKSGDTMTYLVNEPDQWRSDEEPASRQTEWCDHGFQWEKRLDPMPADRIDYIEELVHKNLLLPKDQRRLSAIGCAPYGIQEWSERLTAAFRRWRAAKEDTPAHIAQKHAIENIILFMGGVLGHYVTDLSQPLHVSKYNYEVPADLPHPAEYDRSTLHARFESAYVEKNIREVDIAARVTARPRLLDDWLQELLPYIAASNSHVRQIIQWDVQTPFGSGREPAEARPFTAECLADGATELRDYWYTAWVRSGMPIPQK